MEIQVLLDEIKKIEHGWPRHLITIVRRSATKRQCPSLKYGLLTTIQI